MEEIKRVFKISGIFAVVTLLFGVIFSNKYLYIGGFLGNLVSIWSFYMITVDTNKNLYSDYPKKAAMVSFGKRYIVYLIFLGCMVKFFDLPMLISSAIGLLNIRISIFIHVLSGNIVKFHTKYLEKFTKS